MTVRSFSCALFAALAAIAAPQPAVAQSIPDAVRSEVAQRGVARVIVGVSLPTFAVEGPLAEAEAMEQRAAIRTAVDAALADVPAGLVVTHRFERIPFFSARVNATAMAALGASRHVTSIELDVAEPPVLAQSVPLVNAPVAHAAGATGAGWRVAVLDTGVQTTHPFFAGKTVAEACYSDDGGDGDATTVSVCPGGVTASTAPGSGVNCGVGGCDHGTHVAGIAVGNDGSLIGVAPGAELIAIQVFTQFNDPADCGSSTPCVRAFVTDQIRGLERVLTLAGFNNVNRIAAANLSLGGGQYFDQPSCDAANAARKAAIDNLRSIGVVTIAASGNSGYTNAMGAPGCISSAVSVGSTTKADAISSFSNRAAFLALMAPGSSITSSVPTNGYASLSGTSMATPHVSGAWAVLKHAKPNASVSEILDALRTTGVAIPDGATTYRRIDVGAARSNLLSSTSPPGQPSVISAVASDGELTVTWNSGVGGLPTAHQLNFFSGGTLVTTITAGAVTNAVVPLPAGISGAFAVQVIASNGFGTSPPSPMFTFVLGATPGEPTVTSAGVSSGVLSVQWTSGTGAAPTSHRLDFYQGITLVAQVTTGAASTIAVPIPPTVYGTFSARVTPFNGPSAGPPSAPFEFTIDSPCTTPAPPVVSGSIVDGTATVSWDLVAGATHYLVSAGMAQGGAEYLPPTSFTATAVAASGLPAGFTAWVRVVAVNACGEIAATDYFLQ